MTLSQRAVEAVARAIASFHAAGVPNDWSQEQIDKAEAEAAITAYHAALAVDGLCLVDANEVEKLRSALKGLSDMYAHAWDLVDGGLMMMESSMGRFEKAHQVAYDVLNPDHPLIGDDEDDAAASTGDSSPAGTEG